MKLIKFKGQNCTFAENQPEYIPLPAHRDNEGIIISCWQFTFREKLKVLFGGKLYWQQLSFNSPLQPVMPVIGRNPARLE